MEREWLERWGRGWRCVAMESNLVFRRVLSRFSRGMIRDHILLLLTCLFLFPQDCPLREHNSNKMGRTRQKKSTSSVDAENVPSTRRSSRQSSKAAVEEKPAKDVVKNGDGVKEPDTPAPLIEDDDKKVCFCLSRFKCVFFFLSRFKCVVFSWCTGAQKLFSIYF